MKLHVKKGDLVKVIAGSAKGTTGTVVTTNPTKQLVFVDGIGMIKRKVKPSQLNPRGGTKDVHVGIPVGKVALVSHEKQTTTSRTRSEVDKSAKKVRIAKKTGKEI